jgi:hypothetical protein
MTDVKNASLILRTSDLTAGEITAIGSCNTNRTSMTWNNINLRTLLGDMYDANDEFNLNFTTMVTSVASNPLGEYTDDKNVTINLSGLPFVNQTYDVASQHNHVDSVIGTFLFVQGQIVSKNYYESAMTTFSKNSELCNITIEYQKVLNRFPPNTNGTVFPQVIFMFKIYAVERKVGDKALNATRMLNNQNQF